MLLVEFAAAQKTDYAEAEGGEHGEKRERQKIRCEDVGHGRTFSLDCNETPVVFDKTVEKGFPSR